MIIEALAKRGIAVQRSSQLFRGYNMSDKGPYLVRAGSRITPDNGIYFLENQDGRVFPCIDQVVCVLSGTEYAGKVKNLEEARQLVREGKIYGFPASDLYAEYYNFEENPELESIFKYGYSVKSRKYIEDVMKEIGFLRYTATELGADGVPTRLDPATSEGSVWDEDGEIGRLDNEEWLVQRCVQFEADGYATIKMYFDHKPTAKEIEKAEAIREFEGGPEEVWYVWDERTDDQIPVHWLDADGDICRKVQIMRELGGGL